MLKKIWPFLSKRRQRQYYFLFILMVIVSLFEIFSIGMLIPFLTVLTDPEVLLSQPIIKDTLYFLGMYINISALDNPVHAARVITTIFIIVIILSGALRLTLLYAITKLSYMTGADISADIYNRSINQKYIDHISDNSSKNIDVITIKTNMVIHQVLLPSLTLISVSIVLIAIVITLSIINLKVMLIISSVLGLFYFSIVKGTQKKLNKNSKNISRCSTQVIKTLQESLGAMRDIIISGSQKYFYQSYNKVNIELRKSASSNAFIASSPRYIIESIGIVAIALLAYQMTKQQDEILLIIPVLGAFAFAAQKLLPMLQQIYSSYITIKGVRSSFLDVIELLERELPGVSREIEGVCFENYIKLKDVSFRYSDKNPWIIRNINLTIVKGSKVGFIGNTGSGKSTILDIILGLLVPTEGMVEIDGVQVNKINTRSWQDKVAHVPQNIYMIDGSLKDNIAFGIPKDKINYKRVEEVAKLAQIGSLIDNPVGERGVKLSGGQLQRVGIARALYKNDAEILFLDEATSALDFETELEIMRTINNLEKKYTILIIAHRLSSLKECDVIIEVKNGAIQSGSYNKMIKENNQ
jgi:ATP-binding cassette, subfamily B, bacterial PglK